MYTDFRVVPYFWCPSSLENMQDIYTKQKNRPEYKAFLDTGTPIIGVWDDHDYGINDGGKSFKYRLQSQKVFLDFVDEPMDSIRRQREGIYASYTYGSADQIVKIILLDVRSHDTRGGSNCDVLGKLNYIHSDLHLTFSVVLPVFSFSVSHRYYQLHR